MTNERAVLDWIAFFNLKYNRADLIKTVKSAVNGGSAPVWDTWHMERFTFAYLAPYDDCYYEACRIELLRFCVIRSDFASDILGESGAKKCSDNFSRGQYNSNLLTNVLSAFLFLLDRCGDFTEMYGRIAAYIEGTMWDTVESVREKTVLKKFQPLKQAIEKVASGVKAICYLDGFSYKLYGSPYPALPMEFSDEINSYIAENYGYDFNGIQRSTVYSLAFPVDPWQEKANRMLRYILCPDNVFWEANDSFNLFRFVASVQRNNSLAHAKKIVDYIFLSVKKDPGNVRIIEAQLPFIYLDRDGFCTGMKERDMRFSFDRYTGKYDMSSISVDDCLYPLNCGPNTADLIPKGSECFGKYMAAIYPDDCDKVVAFLRSEISAPSIPVISGEEWTLRTIFDVDIFGYHKNNIDRTAAEAYCPDFFSEENIWNRLYIKTAQVDSIFKDTGRSAGEFFEIYYDLFTYVEEETGISPKFRRDTEGRNEAFVSLSKLLQGAGVNISESNKNEYISALLDRKIASHGEAALFPVLEQLGDAIYSFCTAEMLFYNPSEEDIPRKYDEFANADFQIGIARRMGLDKLYISASSIGEKYNRDTVFANDVEKFTLKEEAEEHRNKEKYIADSLEMVIGAVCRDKGYSEAVKFTKGILRSFSLYGFKDEIRCEEDSGDSADVTDEYWWRIFPAPSYMSGYSREQQTVWRALDKVLLCLTLGTDDKAARDYITQNFRTDIYDINCRDCKVNWVLYYYFNHGLGETLEKYKDRILSNYRKICEHKK